MPRGKRYNKERTKDGKKQAVTTRKLPVIRCSVCRHPIAVRPGQDASRLLTAHYRKVHG